MTEELTETDYGTLGLALGKCKLLNDIVGDGKFKLCVISTDHIKEAAQKGYITMVLPFGFPKMSNEEVSELMQKLHDGLDIAWLKEQRGRRNEIPIKLETGKGYRCQVPECNQRGEIVTLDALSEEGEFEGEFECRLCEKHYKEARSVGQ